jgi:hypothetical protein
MRDKDGKLPTFAWPGGYPVFYLDSADQVLCADCANKHDDPDGYPEDRPVATDVNWEDPNLYCDACSDRIESAYADDDEENDGE